VEYYDDYKQLYFPSEQFFVTRSYCKLTHLTATFNTLDIYALCRALPALKYLSLYGDDLTDSWFTELGGPGTETIEQLEISADKLSCYAVSRMAYGMPCLKKLISRTAHPESILIEHWLHTGFPHLEEISLSKRVFCGTEKKSWKMKRLFTNV